MESLSRTRVLTTITAALCVLTIVPVCSQPTSRNIGKFWHVTDFHYDHTYFSSMLSCNKDNVTAFRFGNYWCDSPWELVTTAINAMATHSPDVDFLLWTGDTVAHIKNDNLSVTINMDVLGNLTSALKDAFPNKTVYATYGNHDYYPADQYPATNNLIYNLTADMWQSWIQDKAQLDNFRKGGYYTLKTTQGLRIVALNTNLYYNSNKVTPLIADPADQLAWLKTVLQTAKTAGEKVIVAAHIPPGVHSNTRYMWFHDVFVKPFDAALQDFADVIVGLHFGHDHYDGFKIFQDKDGKAAAPMLIAPSVTPWRYKLGNGAIGEPHNPSIRLVTYDRDSGDHLDIEQLHLDLPNANSLSSANFTLLYKFTEKYGVPDVTAASLEKLVKRMDSATEGDKLVDQYYRFSSSGADQGDATCDRNCKSRFRCGFRHYKSYADFDVCVDGYVGSATALSGHSITTLLLLSVGLLMATSGLSV